MTEKKDDFIKKILITMFIFLFLFIVTMIVTFFIMGETPDILITAVFAACVGEYSICGLIKNRKERELTARLLKEKNKVTEVDSDDIEEDSID